MGNLGEESLVSLVLFKAQGASSGAQVLGEDKKSVILGEMQKNT